MAHARASKTVQALLPQQQEGGEANVEEVFFTFELPTTDPPCLIPMKQRVEFTDVSQKMWPAAVVLAEYLLQNKVDSREKKMFFCCVTKNTAQDVTKGKRVLELGAGVGFTGIVLSLGGECKSLTLSDYAESGLDLLRENLVLAAAQRADGSSNLDVTKVWKLDWSDANLTDEQLSCFDLVYAADCWYDYEVCDMLTRLVARIARLSKCPFVNATAIRNPKTYQLYRDALQKEGFMSTELRLDSSKPSLFHFDSNERYSVVMERFDLTK